MNSTWDEYLQSQGAIFSTSGDCIDHFGDPDKEMKTVHDGDFITALPGIGTIRVHGDDAQSFLQGQLTNDLSQVNAQQSQLSGYCNPKGRLLALFRITQDEAGYLLHLPTSLLEKTLARLKMFVLMAKVTLDDATTQHARIGVAGEQAKAALLKLIDTLPENNNDVVTTNNLTVIRLPGDRPRFEIIGEAEATQGIWQTLTADVIPVGSGAWQLQDIAAGIPSVVAETVEMFVPQMVNLDLIEGVSFKKGCYPGQEVVARLHYRGTPNRRMRMAEFSASHCPLPGAPLYVATQGCDGQAIGNVVTAQRVSSNRFRALCAIINKHAADNAICLQGDIKERLKLYDLPGITYEAEK